MNRREYIKEYNKDYYCKLMKRIQNIINKNTKETGKRETNIQKYGDKKIKRK